MSLRSLAALLALVMVVVTPFGTTFAASGSSTNAGKLARSSSVARRSAGRVVRRKKTRTTSRRASVKKRAGKKRVSKRRSAKRRTAKRRSVKRRTAKRVRSGRKAARRLSKSRRHVRSRRKMARVDRGPVEATLVKAAYSAMETGKLQTKAQFECIPDELKAVLGQIAERWGTVTVNSSHRTLAHNRRVGGKPRSFHLKCQAADFSVKGSHKGLVAFLKDHPLVGGYKRYRAGHFHIDVGPKRTW